MTCLAVLRSKEGKLIFAADRKISWGMMKAQRMTESKVVKKNGIIIAGTGLSYFITLAHNILKTRLPKKKEDAVHFVNQVFLEEYKKLLIAKGFNRQGTLFIPEGFNTVLLLGFKGKLFELEISSEKDFSAATIDQISAPYAHGCGGYYALGSLLTTEKMDMQPEERLKIALNVAAEISPGCDNNIDIVSE